MLRCLYQVAIGVQQCNNATRHNKLEHDYIKQGVPDIEIFWQVFGEFGWLYSAEKNT